MTHWSGIGGSWGLLRRLFFKLISGPIRYRRGTGYNAEAYWRDRFDRYGLALRGAGHEGLSEAANAAEYHRAAHIFLEACDEAGIDFRRASVLEIGCGTGFYTSVVHAAGAQTYTAMDITTAHFADLKRAFPQYTFVHGDITKDPITSKYDVILMIDVLEHIVLEAQLESALTTLRGALAPGGSLILAYPSRPHSPRIFFYLRFWSRATVLRHFDGCDIRGPMPFRNGELLILRCPRQ